MGHIKANSDTLLRQASITADEYLTEAIKSIDKRFNEKGYAKAHPELVAAFMKVAASDMNYASLAKAQSEAIEELASAINSLSERIENTRE